MRAVGKELNIEPVIIQGDDLIEKGLGGIVSKVFTLFSRKNINVFDNVANSHFMN